MILLVVDDMYISQDMNSTYSLYIKFPNLGADEQLFSWCFLEFFHKLWWVVQEIEIHDIYPCTHMARDP